MKKVWLVVAALVGVLALLVGGYAFYMANVGNPRVVDTLLKDPTGPTAQRVMLITFPDGRVLPVNYIREGRSVYVGADGPWWREFTGGNVPVQVYIRGESMMGVASAIRDDPERTEEVFARLRPTVPEWLPDWLNGVLVVIELIEA